MQRLEHISFWSKRQSSYETLADDLDSVSESSHDDPAVPASAPPSRFLADFTLGFADGLTVPFALTAGLSSLGQTRTVIYAGAAEITAGCISMGIGGYLAAKGEQRPSLIDDENSGDEEETRESVLLHARNHAIDEYLGPLQLPPRLLERVMAHIESSPEIAEQLNSTKNEPAPEPAGTSPIITGLSIALGYLLGGVLPLAPYFFVHNVNHGLAWSFGICIAALFIFGSTKEYVLHIGSLPNGSQARRRQARRTLIKRSIWEGFTMVVLGGLAAAVAVLSVRLFDSLVA
ncbi:Ccc1 family [Nemania sp. FL0916]|nr:Ccc1 family [Nemania sp. FL0916]